MAFCSLDAVSLEFAHPVPDYFHIVCPICLSLLLPDAPRLVACCGNHFCQSCIDNLPTIGGLGKQCPLCKERDFASVPDKNHLRALKSSIVLCIMKKSGCEWKGELGDLVNHLSREGDCAYVMLNCINNCGGRHLRSQLQSHENTSCPRRPASCEYCKTYKSTWQDVNKVHRLKCPQRPIDCPNGCGDQIPYNSCSLHFTTCSLHIIECDFAYCCQWKGHRKLLEEHLQSSWQKHMFGSMKLLADEVKRLTVRVESLESELSQVKVATSQQSVQLQQSASNQKALENRVSQLKTTATQQHKALKNQVSEVKVTTSQQSVQLQQSSKTLELLKGDVSRIILTMPSQQSVQQSASEHKTLDTFVPISQMQAQDDSSDDDDDTSSCSDCATGGEAHSILIRVPNVSSKKSTSTCFTSQAFYYRSYKMLLHVYVNGMGLGMGTHVAVTAQVCPYKKNCKLTWPFTGSLTVRLRDQISHIDHIQKDINFLFAGDDCKKRPTKKNKNKEHGELLFIPHSSLKSPYVVKNTMIFEIPEVEIKDKK